MEGVTPFSGIVRAGQFLAPVVPERAVLHVTNIALPMDVNGRLVELSYNTPLVTSRVVVCTLDVNNRQYSTDLILSPNAQPRFGVRSAPGPVLEFDEDEEAESPFSSKPTPAADVAVHISGFIEVVALPDDDGEGASEEDDETEGSSDAGADFNVMAGKMAGKAGPRSGQKVSFVGPEDDSEEDDIDSDASLSDSTDDQNTTDLRAPVSRGAHGAAAKKKAAGSAKKERRGAMLPLGGATGKSVTPAAPKIVATKPRDSAAAPRPVLKKRRTTA